jgi:hypothetical protein
VCSTANLCVLLRFDERLCAGIHYCLCVFYWTFVTDYVLELIIACVCVCSCKNHVTLPKPNVIVCSEFVNRCWNWVVCSKLVFTTELCVLQRICVLCWDLLKDYVLEFIIACVYSTRLLWQIMCWNWLLHVCVCSCKNHVTLLKPNVQLHCLQWICKSLLKLSCL